MRKVIYLLSFVLCLSVLASCTRIDAGHEGILVNQVGTDKGVSNVSLVTGTVFYNPITKDVHEFPIFVQTIDYAPFSVNAKDGSVFTVDPTISFKVMEGNSPKIFAKYRKDLEEITGTTLYNYVKDAFRIQFNNYTTDSIISRRGGFENSVQLYLQKEFEQEGFHLEQLTSGMQYPEIITNSINAKNKAVQDAQRVENELRLSEANARKQIVTAESSAKALLISAQAEADANKLKQQTLTPMLLQQQYLEKWNGVLPSSMYGNSPMFFKETK